MNVHVRTECNVLVILRVWEQFFKKCFFQFCLLLRKQKCILDFSRRDADLDYPLMSLWSCVNIKMQPCAGVLLTARKEQNHPCKTIWRGGTGPEIAPLSWTHSSAISSLQLQWCPTNAKAFKEAKEQGFILQTASEQNIFPKIVQSQARDGWFSLIMFYSNHSQPPGWTLCTQAVVQQVSISRL